MKNKMYNKIQITYCSGSMTDDTWSFYLTLSCTWFVKGDAPALRMSYTIVIVIIMVTYRALLGAVQKYNSKCHITVSVTELQSVFPADLRCHRYKPFGQTLVCRSFNLLSHCLLRGITCHLRLLEEWFKDDVLTRKLDNFFEWNPATRTRGHPCKLYERNCMHKSRAVFFSERVMNAWNQLSESTDFFSC